MALKDIKKKCLLILVMSKTFKDYYQDPVFRKKHRMYMKAKVICECGSMSSRNNMPRHKRTNKHLRLMSEKQKANGLEKMEQEIKQLHKRLEKLEKS